MLFEQFGQFSEERRIEIRICPDTRYGSVVPVEDRIEKDYS
jgi:hypothetical protein